MHNVRTIFHLITVRNEVIFSQASVSHFVQSPGGDVCLSACWDTHIPRQVHSPWAGTTPDRYTLGRYCPSMGRYTPPRRYIPLPPGRYTPQAGKPCRQVHPQAGTPPAGTPPGTPPGQIHPLVRYTSPGRYTMPTP